MLTIKEALVLTGVTRKTLYNRMNKGDLPFYVNDVSGRRLFDQADLERVFGSGVTHTKTKQITHTNTQQITQYTPELEVLIQQAINKAIEPLVLEIQQLKAAMTRSNDEAEQRLTRPFSRASSFSDLLEAFD